MRHRIIIGTRGSALALCQSNKVKALLEAQDPDLDIQLKIIKTQGDIDQQSSLSDIGGKGVFIKAIEQELMNKRIDMAVHSLKDVTSRLAENSELAAFLTPDTQRDCVVMSNGTPLNALTDLPDHTVIATGSLRRKLLLHAINPNWIIKDIRGNVDSRIKKCQDGYADALLLSEAGLLRLNRESDISLSLDPKTFIPAPGQGVIAVQCHSENQSCLALLKEINDPKQSLLSSTELRILYTIGLDCNYPLGMHSSFEDNQLRIKSVWGPIDCSQRFYEDKRCDLSALDAFIQSYSAQIKAHLES